MVADESLDPRSVAPPLGRLRGLDAGLNRLQSFQSDPAIIGLAEDLLHLSDKGIQGLCEGSLQAGGEYLHGVTQPLAADAHLMKMLIIMQITLGRLIKQPQLFGEERDSQVSEGAPCGHVRGEPEGPNRCG